MCSCACVSEAEPKGGPAAPRTIGDTEEPEVCLSRSGVGSRELPVDFVLKNQHDSLGGVDEADETLRSVPASLLVSEGRGFRGTICP